MQGQNKLTPQRKSQSSNRDTINVQEYRSSQFKEPDQLSSGSEQQLGERIGPIKQRPSQQVKSSTRSSLQTNQNQLILQFKISQLQKICSTLTSANQKLLDKIQELQQQSDKFKRKINALQEQRQRKSSFVESQFQQDEAQMLQKLQKQATQDDEQQSEDSGLNLQEEVVDIQSMIKDYREELKKAQQINKNNKQAYQNKINELDEELSDIKNKLSQMEAINKQMQQQLIDLQDKNQGLQTQIETIINTNAQSAYYQDLQSKRRAQSKSSQYQTPMQQRRYIRGNRQYNNFYEDDQFSQMSPFDSSVQIQLEKLIQKLVKQLEYERLVKKKMADEMKRIQKDLLESEKQIMTKNKKIYDLQMDLIKGQKSYAFNGNNSHIINGQSGQIKRQQKQKYSSPFNNQISSRIRQKYPGNEKQRSKIISSPIAKKGRAENYERLDKNRQYLAQKNSKLPSQGNMSKGKLLQTFTLLQLLNEPTINLGIDQKLHICLKLVNFYEQKIYTQKNYNVLMLENILITNFNKINLRLIKIRVDQNAESQNQKNKRNKRNEPSEDSFDGPEKTIWNLGFLLNYILVDTAAKQQDFGNSSPDKKILEEIQNLLDNRSLNKQVFPRLKIEIQQAFKLRLAR